MKKIILGMFSVMLMSLTLSAQGFVGFNIGKNTLTSEDGFEDSGMIYDINFGYQKNQWRTKFGFNMFDSDDSYLEQYEIYVGADYFFTDELSQVRPYIGGLVGFATTEYDYYDVDSCLTYGGGQVLYLKYQRI
jgi:hypothetical protein